ncbi:hypothetical protein [Frigoribacterium sp. VKM Ac-2530]|uniref:hypothetical protein n=1 Tax=Frigoribacterium sp. VKM Ac-2530 TaxID=2783822 RepID=UPI00188AB5D9|nr:hypothetical protein [Frigoribacterium sp. VKM Ac-2530]MBF4578952.1 hypothetical protein [Frigoribacterium sp. VKM Ac-2530]
MPKLRTETFGGGDQSWLGSTHGIANARTGTLSLTDFTPATHYPDGFIPSGTRVDASNEKALTPFTGAEGEQLGFVLTDSPVVNGEAAPVAVLRHGIINVANLPGTFTAPTAGAAGFVFVGGDA